MEIILIFVIIISFGKPELFLKLIPKDLLKFSNKIQRDNLIKNIKILLLTSCFLLESLCLTGSIGFLGLILVIIFGYAFYKFGLVALKQIKQILSVLELDLKKDKKLRNTKEDNYKNNSNIIELNKSEYGVNNNIYSYNNEQGKNKGKRPKDNDPIKYL